MAKQIDQGDVVKDGHLDNAIKEAQTYLDLMIKIDEQVVKTAKDLKKIATAADTKSAKGIQELNVALTESAKKKAAVIKIDKEKANLEIKLKALNSERIQKNEVLKVQAQEQAKVNKQLARETLGLVDAYEKESKRLVKLRKQLKDLILTEGEGSAKTKKLAAEVTKLDQRLKKADASAGEFGRNVGNYPKGLKNATAGLKKFAGALGLLGGIQLAIRGFKDFFNVIKNFDQAQANLSSVLGVTRDEMSALTEQSKELGSSTKFTASQVSELQLEYAKLGFTQNEIKNVTEATLQLASAAGTDLANAATITGSTLRGFGLDSTETQRVVDVMAKSFSSSSLDIDKFKVAMAAVAPVAKGAGVDIERTTALLGTLTDRGIDASSAGTGLRNMFLSATAAGITFEEALEQVRGAQDKTAKSLELFGKRGATLGVILAESGEDVNALEKKLNGAAGAAEEMADKQLDTLGGSLDLLRSAWEGAILEMDDATNTSGGLKDVIKLLADNLGDMLRAVVSVVGSIAKMIVHFSKATDSAQGLADAVSDLLGTLFSWIPGMKQASELLRTNKVLTDDLTETQKRNNLVNGEALKIGKEILKQNQAEIQEVQILLEALTDENTTRDEKNEIIAKLNEKYPETLKNIDLETASTAQLIEVKKQLVAQILNEAVQTAKADKLRIVSKNLIDAQTGVILASTENEKNHFKEQIAIWQHAFGVIEEVAAKVQSEVGGLAEGIDYTGMFDTATDEVTRLKNKLAELNRQLLTAPESQREAIEANIKETTELLAKADEERRRLLGLNDDAIEESNDKSVKSFKTSEEEKTKILEKEFIARKNIRIKALKSTLEEEAKIFDPTGPSAFTSAMIAANEEFVKQRKIREAELKKMRDDSLAIFKEITDGLQENIDKRREERRREIDESTTEITRLQGLAAQGNTDAAESIKAERANIAKEKLEIETLEKKKRNLLIVVTALEKANQNLNNGDNNAFKNASASLSGFIAGLPTFYQGTNGTLADSLGRTGTKDGHIIRADDGEMILNGKKVNELQSAGLNTTDAITQAALRGQNNMVNSRAMRGHATAIMTDKNIVNKLDSVISAISTIEYTQQHIDILGLKETIIKGNKTTNKDYNPPTFLA